jgi:hypothetical protein
VKLIYNERGGVLSPLRERIEKPGEFPFPEIRQVFLGEGVKMHLNSPLTKKI